MTQDQLREALDYDPETGVFRWRAAVGNRVKPGDLAGTKDGRGYLQFGFCGRLRLAHRMAWLWVYGEIPDAQIDHLNGIRTDNRIANLRLAGQSENSRNQRLRRDNQIGFKGVSYHRKTGKWAANISIGGNQIYLGLFSSPEAADEVVRKKRIELHGEFANHG